MLSNSVNLFSENMHSSASLTGMSLTKISFVLWWCQTAVVLNASLFAKRRYHWVWWHNPMASKPGGQTSQPLQLVRICIYSDVCHNDFHFPSIFYLFFFKQDTPFPCFLASENFRRVAGSCFQHFYIYKDWEPSVGWFVYECTSQSFKSCAEDGGRRKRGPDSALIINSGETAAERTGTCHVVPRCTASFIKPCINIRPCKNCWKIAAQMPRKKCCFLV